MKSKQILLSAIALCMTAVTSHAAITIQQSATFADGNSFTATPTKAFDVVNPDSIFIATFYSDNAAPALSNPRFGNNGGIGTGDVGPTVTITDGRLVSYIFVNPSTDSGLSFRVTNASGGAAAAFYEVNGANTDPLTFTTSTSPTNGATSITTSTTGEMVISFAARNNAGDSALDAGTIFPGIHLLNGGAIFGGGTINAAFAIAPTIGSQNIAWATNAQAIGRIAIAFEAIPESSTALLGGLGLLALLRRRR